MEDKKINVFEEHIQELHVAKKEGNRKEEGIAYLNLGDYYYGLAYFEQAKRHYTEALRIFKEISFSAGKGKACGNLGIAYHRLGNFKKARKYLKQQLSIAKKVGDRDQEGNANGNIGCAYYSLGNFKRAIVYYQEHLSIAKGVGNRAGEGAANCNLGNAYKSLGNFKRAIEYHEQTLSIAKEVGDRAVEGKANGNLGNTYHSLGNFKQAIEYHKQHLSIAKEVRDRAGEGGANGALGIVYRSLGNFKLAIEYHEKDLSIAMEVGDRAGKGRANGNLGNAYHSVGSFKQAIKYHEQHLSIAKERGDMAGEGKANGNLGNAYSSLGSFKRAIEYHEQSLSIAREVGDRAGEGLANGNLGNDYYSLGNFKRAIEYHEQSLSIVKEVGDRAGEGKRAIEYHEKDLSIAKEVEDRAGEGRAIGNVGNAYHSLGNFKRAIEYHKEKLSIAKEVGDRAGEGMANAIKCHEQHLSIAKEVGDRAGEGEANGNLGNAYDSLGNFKRAIEYHEQSLSIAKEVGNRAGEGYAYGNLSKAYSTTGKLENTLLCNEQYLTISKETENPLGQGRACYNLGLVHEVSGSLCKALNFYRLGIKHFDETRFLLQLEDAWKISFRDTNQFAYTALWRALLKNREDDEALFAAERGRAQALTDILKVQFGVDEELSSAVATKEPISAVMKYLPVQTVFMALAGNTINFWLLRTGSRINYREKEIENGSADSLIKTTLKQIGAGAVVRCENRSVHRHCSRFSCSGEVVEESFQSFCVSDNPLQSLYDFLISPIADLLQGDDLIFVPDGPFCLAPYSALSDSVRIRTFPSLTALKLIASAPVFNSKNEPLLVGDPCLKEITWGTGGPMYEQLPCAKKEVEVIGKLLHTAPLTGENATKAEVLKRMKSVALIHIAAHGDDEFGEIILTPNLDRLSETPEEEDYMLTMRDVQAVRLQAKLVVLSCCHSGNGEVRSEGVVGIARAFLCAGARSVLVSLWAIDDEATLLFMKSFYQHLANRKSASLALHHAMKSLRERKEYSAIKYWAPFVLIGDDVTFDFGPQELEMNETSSTT
ncbi:tetratricopeptide repeat protein 28-like [Montipora capricornis]|uniref:tetratricopeptide repeat protein 28-like n=1 Tax=Montipora capricornis TaxID=246305 RepID=UPI0035F16872